MIAILTLAAGLALAAAAWAWAARSIDGATRVAVVAVLGVTAATFNVIVPVASIEATTTVVLCAGIVLGARTGIAVALVAQVASSVAGGIGVWTIWQLIALSCVALVGDVVGRSMGAEDVDWFERSRLLLLGVVAVACTVAYDVMVTVPSVLVYGPAGVGTPTERILAALLLGAMFTLTHVACTTALTVLGGPSLLHALGRARLRLCAVAVG